ncbi:MAG: hypothetical protein WDO56_26190 [Gammaproteobacteria bacterium]
MKISELGKIDYVGEQHRQDGAGRAQRRVFRVVAMLDPRAHFTEHETHEIQDHEQRGPDRPLEREREEKECEHVEQQVTAVRVHEAAGDEAMPFVLADEPVRPEYHSVDERGRAQPGNNDDQRDHENGAGRRGHILRTSLPVRR